MPRFRSSVLKRKSDGTYSFKMRDEDRELLRSLAGQLHELLEVEQAQDSVEDDPALRRLFPTAYPDDPFKDAEYQVIAGDELRKSRLSALETLTASAEKTVLTEAEVMAWVQSLNAIRLVLGTRLDVSEDEEPFQTNPYGPEDDLGRMRFIYDYLSILLEMLLGGIAV